VQVEGNEMEAWILIGVALLYALITLAGYLDRRDDRRDEQQRLRWLGWKPPIGIKQMHLLLVGRK